MKSKLLPIALMRKTTQDERAHEVVSMNRFLRIVRWFIIVVVLGFIAMGIIVWIVVGLVESNRQNINDYKMQQAQTHQERLDEDKSLQEQISAAVCTFVDPIPAGNPKIDVLRAKYGCTSPAATPSASAAPSAAPKPSPTSTHSLSVGPTVQKASPGPTSTVTTTKTASSTATPTSPPAIINLPTLICIAPGVCI